MIVCLLVRSSIASISSSSSITEPSQGPGKRLDKEVDDLEEAIEVVREEAAGRDLESEAVNEVVLPNFNKYYRQSTKRWSLS